jgi:hypothetical protein
LTKEVDRSTYAFWRLYGIGLEAVGKLFVFVGVTGFLAMLLEAMRCGRVSYLWDAWGPKTLWLYPSLILVAAIGYACSRFGEKVQKWFA